MLGDGDGDKTLVAAMRTLHNKRSAAVHFFSFHVFYQRPLAFFAVDQ